MSDSNFYQINNNNFNNNNNDFNSFYMNQRAATPTTDSFDFLEDQNEWNQSPTIYINITKPKTNIYLSICAILTIILLIGSIIFWGVFIAQFTHSTPNGTISGPISLIDKISTNNYEEYDPKFHQEKFGSCNYNAYLGIETTVRNVPASIYYFTMSFENAKGGYIHYDMKENDPFCVTMTNSLSLASISSCEPASRLAGYGADYSFSLSNYNNSEIYLVLAVTPNLANSENLNVTINFDITLWVTDEDESEYQRNFDSLLTIGIVGELTIFSVLLLALIAILRSRKKFNDQYNTAYQSLPTNF